MSNPLRTALVTGGSRGIGRAIVDSLRAVGVRTDAADRYHCDFSDLGATKRFASRDVSLHPYDVLVNCAGISIGASLLSPSAADEFDTTYAVNVRAPFLLTQAVIPGMLQRGYGRIVNIASIYSLISRPQRTAYTVSKCALHGLTLALSAEFASQGVLTNTVSPGVIHTDMTHSRLTELEIHEHACRIPVRRLGSAEEVASLVAWLASDANTYVTGQNIAIDGGYVGV